ncbi:hypothetical protein CQA18_24940, partial [Enterobacter hormaechei]
PKHPLYVDFLAEDAQKVIGEVHPQTLPARRLLGERRPPFLLHRVRQGGLPERHRTKGVYR